VSQSRDSTVGLYVHVPFCERVCPYCDFAVVAARPLSAERERRYLAALLRELEIRRGDYRGRSLASVYLGGGTPSLLRPESVASILEAARAAFRPAERVEVTLEANPGTVERERLPGFRQAGVDRLSLGIQSFDDDLLRRLGRAHRAEEGRRTLAAARRAGFENLSLDLILGAPGGGLALLERDLDQALAHRPEHLSSYELTIEPGTPFALAARRGQLALPTEEESVRMFERLEARLAAAGLQRYELSNYARRGFESRHNRRYWERAPVLGLGMGAWSSLLPAPGAPHGGRRANPRQLEAYLEGVEAGLAPAAESDRLGPRAARGEALFLGLRQTAGLRAEGFAAEFGGPPRAFFETAIRELVTAGLLAENPKGDLALTARGQLLSDSVFERFV
jgi:oxygen-independent coproporphyrinogen-3 oxidase